MTKMKMDEEISVQEQNTQEYRDDACPFNTERIENNEQNQRRNEENKKS